MFCMNLCRWLMRIESMYVLHDEKHADLHSTSKAGGVVVNWSSD